MVMIPRALLPHKVTFRPYEGEGPRGPMYGSPVEIGHAYVEDKHKLVRAGSDTEVLSSTLVVVDPHWHVPDESLVTVWAGTPREREAKVILTSLYDHPRAPSNLEIRLE